MTKSSSTTASMDNIEQGLIVLANRQKQLQEAQTVVAKNAKLSKEIKIGAKGGLYYLNDKGNKIYLNQRQKVLCQQGRLTDNELICSTVNKLAIRKKSNN